MRAVIGFATGSLILNANSVNNIQASSAFNVGFIPTATLTYKNLFISGSYMATRTISLEQVRRILRLPVIFFSN